MDIVLIVFLTLLNGAFAMSELALASSRKARLSAMAEDGDKGAATALQLLEHPTQFLSSVQVGITSIGMLNGIVGEAAFSDDLGQWFLGLGLDDTAASVLATAIVVTVITFITIVFGELVPKRIAQLYPETVANWVARLNQSGENTFSRPALIAASCSVWNRAWSALTSSAEGGRGVSAVTRPSPATRARTTRASRTVRPAEEGCARAMPLSPEGWESPAGRNPGRSFEYRERRRRRASGSYTR